MNVMELLAEAKVLSQRSVRRVPKKCKQAAMTLQLSVQEIVENVLDTLHKMLPKKERGLKGLRKRQKLRPKHAVAGAASKTSAPDTSVSTGDAEVTNEPPVKTKATALAETETGSVTDVEPTPASAPVDTNAELLAKLQMLQEQMSLLSAMQQGKMMSQDTEESKEEPKEAVSAPSPAQPTQAERQPVAPVRPSNVPVAPPLPVCAESAPSAVTVRHCIPAAPPLPAETETRTDTAKKPHRLSFSSIPEASPLLTVPPRVSSKSKVPAQSIPEAPPLPQKASATPAVGATIDVAALAAAMGALSTTNEPEEEGHESPRSASRREEGEPSGAPPAFLGDLAASMEALTRREPLDSVVEVEEDPETKVAGVETEAAFTTPEGHTAQRDRQNKFKSLRVFTRNIPGEDSMGFDQVVKVAAKISLRRTPGNRSPGGTPIREKHRAPVDNELFGLLYKKLQKRRSSVQPEKRKASSALPPFANRVRHHRRASSVCVDPSEWDDSDKEN